MKQSLIIYDFVDQIIKILYKYNEFQEINVDNLKNELFSKLSNYIDPYILYFVVFYIIFISDLKYTRLNSKLIDIFINYKRDYSYYDLNPEFEIVQANDIYNINDFYSIIDDYDYNPEDENYYNYTLSKIIEYFINTRQWNLIIDIINDNIKNHNNIINTIINKYLVFYPDNILCKILNRYTEYNYSNIFTNIIYYSNYKINNEKYIPFELFPINNGKILYTLMLLINDNYVKTIDNDLLKLNYFFNKLNYDLQLKICGINNINFDEIRLSSMYLL